MNLLLVRRCSAAALEAPDEGSATVKPPTRKASPRRAVLICSQVTKRRSVILIQKNCQAG
jgi:hypothetical protein